VGSLIEVGELQDVMAIHATVKEYLIGSQEFRKPAWITPREYHTYYLHQEEISQPKPERLDLEIPLLRYSTEKPFHS